MNPLDIIYYNMNIKNKPSNMNDIIYDIDLNNNNSYLNNYCFAIYAINNWYLEPSWIRLNNWINSILLNNEAVVYSVHPDNNGGILHQTLLQFISFKESTKYTNEEINKSLKICKEIMKENNIYIRIIYRGLVWTKTGLALRGYPSDMRDYDKIIKLRILIETKLKELKLPCDIPYTNDIIHSTFLRWKNKPSDNVIKLLNKSIDKWDECVFGEIRISKWIVGKASWKMLDYERNDIYTVDSPNKILHRGIRKIDNLLENSPETLNKRNETQYYVECDIWYKNKKWYYFTRCY